MSTANKLTYLNDTKQELKQKINNLGGDITDQTTFRQYADELQNVYDILPKTSYAEGSNITLSNTLKGKLDFEDGIVGIGDTQQNGTPTPDSPQEIEVVRGKNLLDMSNAVGGTNNGITCTFNSDKSYSFKGTATDNNINVWFLGNYNSSTTLFTLKAGTYHIQDVILFNGTTPLNYSTFYNGPITLANDTNITGVRAPQVTSGTTYNETKYPMIVKGSQATSYLPYNTLEIEERGKNLAYIEVEGKYRSSASGNFSINANYNGYIANVRQNTTYTGGFTNMSSNFNDVSNLCYFDKNMIFISGEAYNTANKTFTTPSNCAYVTMAVKTTIIDFQLEEGSTATDYEPYQEPKTYQLSLGEYEFAKIPDTNYRDTIVYDIENDKVYKKAVIEEHTGLELAGSFQLSSGYSDSIYLCAFNNNFMATNYVNTTSLCNYFSGEYVYSIQKVANNMRMGPSALVICVLKSDFADINALNQYFTDNGANIKFLLVSKTPTETEITGTLKDQIKALYNSHSFTGTTIIEINGQLPLIIKVRALKGE